MVQATDLSLTFTRIEKCPACRGTEWQAIHKLPDFSLMRCDCGHKFINPCLDEAAQAAIYESSETLAKINPALVYYYEYLDSIAGTRTEQDYLEVLSFLEPLAKGKRLLDVGCGSGIFLNCAKQNGWQVTGLDATSQNAEQVKERFGIDVIVSPFEKYEKTDQRWDVITLWDLVEHLTDPIVLINQAYELLDEGGVLVLATPNDRCLLSRIARLASKVSFGVVSFPLKRLYLLEHTSYFNPDSLANLVKRKPFDVLRVMKTETDLKRYAFPPPLRITLSVFFWIARLVHHQNRMILFARKSL